MSNLRRLLPSFRGLVVFEAAGRLGSFTEAGRELGMTQAAVSHAVKALEADVGQALFARGHRRVLLTEAGRQLHSSVSIGLGLITRSVEDMAARAGENHVTLSVSTAFATLWMVPRMQAVRAALPDIEIRLQTSDRDINIAAENIPLGVRGGRPEQWARYHAAPFAPEEIVAVASPAYVAAHGMPASPQDLLAHNLVHLDEPFRKAASWADWLKSAGVAGLPKGKGLRANDYVPLLQAALDGDGVALGWRHLVAGFLASGRLVQLTDHCLVTGDAFHVVWPKGAALADNAVRVRDWMVAQG